MPIETLKRIMWRIREKQSKSDIAPNVLCLKQITDAIYEEVGIDDRTVKKYIKLLIDKGLLKRTSRFIFEDVGEVV